MGEVDMETVFTPEHIAIVDPEWDDPEKGLLAGHQASIIVEARHPNYSGAAFHFVIRRSTAMGGVLTGYQISPNRRFLSAPLAFTQGDKPADLYPALCSILNGNPDEANLTAFSAPSAKPGEIGSGLLVRTFSPEGQPTAEEAAPDQGAAQPDSQDEEGETE